MSSTRPSPTLRRFTVIPRLPPALDRLRELAQNLSWAWSPLARELFVRIDPPLHEAVSGNPIELLARVKQSRLDELAADDAFLSHQAAAHAALMAYLSQKTWFEKSFPEAGDARIAYFSMEYGLHESLPIYSGGLGVLAGDHLKSASDLGLPLVGVGLAYAEGYFRQTLAGDGWQGERYPMTDWNKLPVSPVTTSSGERLVIHVQYPDRVVHAQIWRVQVGRVPLFLLDANLEENTPADRAITGALYGGDQELRVRQEIMLGIGGVHALEAIGLRPTVCHMNEGHSAFLALERIARLMRERGASFAVASEATSAGNVFTTHTPVPAGNDAFDPELVRRYLEPYRAALGIDEQQLLDLGKTETAEPGAPFSMPVFAFRTADHKNGVSALHGEVSRRMWNALWPHVPEHEVPIDAITNGVHVPTWISGEMSALLTRYLGPRWAEATDDRDLWARVHEIPDAELWQAHEHRRHRLVTLARQWRRERAAHETLSFPEEVLDPRALTIGFARRFATYKRATLLFTDVARVTRLLGDAERPVQLVFAGKAHPQDKGGKELIRGIVHASRQAGLRGRVVFLEDYEMRIARALVSGVDVWLNTPRRPHEASGTSGMKAAANGALNLSVLDGWWAEAYAKHGARVGWAIGRGEEYEDGEGDAIEAGLLYDVLEREVVPLFFDRDASGLPRRWIEKMKHAMASLVPEFNTARMVKSYASRFYAPAIDRAARMTANDLAGAKDLARWKQRIHAAWPEIEIAGVTARTATVVRVGDPVEVEAIVDLGALEPGDVAVELYHGPTLGGHALPRGALAPMRVERRNADGTYTFVGHIPTEESGSHAFAARVMPWNEALRHTSDTSLVRWA
ncbi:MAG: alpha-glucan family phosphorylase [Labilithrix sp.]|nr:alpha-glucan family phosphorylase [Labilithrix sp.]